MRIFCIIYNVELQASAKKLGGERGKKKKKECYFQASFCSTTEG